MKKKDDSMVHILGSTVKFKSSRMQVGDKNYLEMMCKIRIIPYSEGMMSRLILNQWFHGQRLTLTGGHLVAEHLKPKYFKMSNFEIVKINNG